MITEIEPDPFDANDMEITIFVYQPDRRSMPIGKISVVAATKGTLDYDIQIEGISLPKNWSHRNVRKSC